MLPTVTCNNDAWVDDAGQRQRVNGTAKFVYVRWCQKCYQPATVTVTLEGGGADELKPNFKFGIYPTAIQLTGIVLNPGTVRPEVQTNHNHPLLK
jgi:hypothetical protein